MNERTMNLSEKEVRTILAVIECFREQNHFRYDEMNRTMGSITIEEMLSLNSKMQKFYDPEKYAVED